MVVFLLKNMLYFWDRLFKQLSYSLKQTSSVAQNIP